jgi:hypothetical protein
MSALKEVGDCPGCDHAARLHAGGMCYGPTQPTGCGWCGWRILGEGNVWGVPPGWWHWRDLPSGKSFTVVPEEVDEDRRRRA